MLTQQPIQSRVERETGGRMLRWGQEYVDKGIQYYEERHREQQIRLLKKRAAKLGLLVV